MSDPPPIGLLVMAYGTAAGPEDVERYYTDIRGGRPPSPEHLRDLMGRYAAIGNRFPLLEITRRQAGKLERELNARGPHRFRAYLGMKHSPPFISEAVAQMREDGIGQAVALVMAPHWSRMSIETYVERVEEALAGGGPSFTYIRDWHDHPSFIALLGTRVREALGRLAPPERDRAMVVFTAHSLPTRTLTDGSVRCNRCDDCPVECRYSRGLRDTAEAVATVAGLASHDTAWQSAGRGAGSWWGPTLLDVIDRAAASDHRAVVVCACGFVADHLEILYDLDIEARRAAEGKGLRFARTEMPNDDRDLITSLAAIVEAHLRVTAGRPA